MYSQNELLRFEVPDSRKIYYGGRLQRLVQSLPSPERQQPSLLYYIGKTSKSNTIAKLFPRTVFTYSKAGIVHAVLDADTIEADHPTIILEDTAHQHKPNNNLETLRTKLLFPFVNVICVISGGCGGLDGVKTKIATWAAHGSTTRVSRSVLPRLVVVITKPDTISATCESGLLSTPGFQDTFSNLHVIEAPPLGRRWIAHLQTVLKQEQHASHQEHLKFSTSLSAVHISALFDRATEGFLQNEPFDIINATRHQRPVSPALEQHLRTWIELCVEVSVPLAVISSLIASALVMDAYPPGMHGKPF